MILYLPVIMNSSFKVFVLSDADQAQTKVNGEASSEKKDDSGNETGVEINEPDEDNESFYDKTKSFFDNISCEAVERSKG